jgi:hypothetical protein
VLVPFETLTVIDAEPEPPIGSVAVAVSVWLPLASLVVSHENAGPVPATATPSAFSP